jgi:hypothetical protein
VGGDGGGGEDHCRTLIVSRSSGAGGAERNGRRDHRRGDLRLKKVRRVATFHVDSWKRLFLAERY